MSRSTPALLVLLVTAPAVAADAPDFARDVQPVLTKYCAGCHNAADAVDNGGFALHDFASLMKGGEDGVVLVAGDADGSRLIDLVERTAEPAMPPEGEPAPTAEEVALLKAWVAAGAKGPSGDDVPTLNVPDVAPTGPVRRPVHAAAWSPDGATLAVGRYRSVELLGPDLAPRSTIDGLAGRVSALVFLPDGRLFAAGGEAGLPGEIGLWDTATGQPLWKKPAHRDAVTAGAVSPDGRLLATGGYDQAIILWDAATGEPKATLTGHNSAISGLAFHPTKPILASASADRTIKLWDATTGERLDTLIEPTKEQTAIAFSPDGSRLAAAGADSRVRVWSVAEGRAGTTKILLSHFAHEGPIVALAYSRDGRTLLTASQDKTLKVWDAVTLAQAAAPAAQPDWVAAIAVGSTTAALGRLDGTVELVSLPTPVAPPATQPEASAPGASAVAGTAPADEPMPAPIAEAEPNDDPAAAATLTLPGVVEGVLNPGESKEADADSFRFAARAGETWIFETNAARAGSPADTKLDVLRSDGSPVERLRFRALRDSAINFRGISAVSPGLRVDYWEEMELDEYMYLSGEICRVFRMPQGPDSDMQLYSVGGQRRAYFDATPVAHALFEQVYIVEPHPPGTPLPANGLPIFSLPFENDDDSERKLGRDSQLTFTAPADGEYVVRVRDARGFGGPDHKYSLTARRPRPDFAVSIAEGERTVPVGSGQRLSLKVDRIDGFNGPVAVEIGNLPPGFAVSTPVVIEAGHAEAKAVLSAAPDAAAPPEDVWKAATATATADLAGRPVVIPVPLPAKVTVGPKPPLVATLAPEGGATEIVVRPGESVTAMLTIERNGYDAELNFEIENLPHGVIVDHIGLSGVLIRNGETQRQVVLSCAKWVPAMTRPIFAVGKGQGDQASGPVTLRVDRGEELAKAGG